MQCLKEIATPYMSSHGIPFSGFELALVLGRQDVAQTFLSGRRLDVDRALSWYVLHGVSEHRLWPSLTPSFVKALNAPTFQTAIGAISPLQAIILAARPDLNSITGTQPAKKLLFENWLRLHGVYEHSLLGVLDAGALKTLMKLPASGGRDTQDAVVPHRQEAAVILPERLIDPPCAGTHHIDCGVSGNMERYCCTGDWHWDLIGAATVDSSIVSFAMEFPRIVGELHVFVETAADSPKEVDIWVNGTKALQNPTNSFRGVKSA